VKPLFVSGVFVSNAGLARVKPGNGTRPGGNVREDVGYEDDDFYSDGRTPIPRTWLPLDPNDDAAPAGA
jgi:hypothetical protein